MAHTHRPTHHQYVQLIRRLVSGRESRFGVYDLHWRDACRASVVCYSVRPDPRSDNPCDPNGPVVPINHKCIQLLSALMLCGNAGTGKGKICGRDASRVRIPWRAIGPMTEAHHPRDVDCPIIAYIEDVQLVRALCGSREASSRGHYSRGSNPRGTPIAVHAIGPVPSSDDPCDVNRTVVPRHESIKLVRRLVRGCNILSRNPPYSCNLLCQDQTRWTTLALSLSAGSCWLSCSALGCWSGGLTPDAGANVTKIKSDGGS